MIRLKRIPRQEVKVKENALFGRLNRGLIGVVFAVVAAVAFPSASFAQVRVILSG